MEIDNIRPDNNTMHGAFNQGFLISVVVFSMGFISTGTVNIAAADIIIRDGITYSTQYRLVQHRVYCVLYCVLSHNLSELL